MANPEILLRRDFPEVEVTQPVTVFEEIVAMDPKGNPDYTAFHHITGSPWDKLLAKQYIQGRATDMLTRLGDPSYQDSTGSSWLGTVYYQMWYVAHSAALSADTAQAQEISERFSVWERAFQELTQPI